ncbi:uncharacterized protein BO80DRAFT_14756 [Aspergillus ibericus CBS 121593]|uniref:Uncharacterized protein n=1 Tax=Aspergillus ibericus CBS 121593 TaxID=1448316 RepID=A0A395HAE1_9EURO|nr:hypothetical protein BO80DRAFT_14756 [Aspergillus ibericus CBS 121593]RAL03174.1 hypothetical protein BO80DRAFT_14756 [Aspergillus ibericus CBS 121593]
MIVASRCLILTSEVAILPLVDGILAPLLGPSFLLPAAKPMLRTIDLFLQCTHFMFGSSVSLDACQDSIRFADGDMRHVDSLVLQGMDKGTEIGGRRAIVATLRVRRQWLTYELGTRTSTVPNRVVAHS